MSEQVGEAIITIRTDESGVDYAGAGRRAGEGYTRGFKTSLKGLAGAIGGAIVAREAFQLGKAAITQASDLNESLNAVNVTYGRQSRAVKALGREAATSLGLSNTEFNSLAVRYSAFAKTIGGDKRVVRVLDDLTERAADFASVMNLEVAESAQLFQSGLAGETEPLRKYGIDLSAAKVEAFALAEGIVKSKDELDESAKVQARYALLMQQTSKTQGDFANTSDSLANKQRILSARWADAQAELGGALLPIMEDLVGFVADKGLPVFEDFSDWFVTDGVPAMRDLAREVKPLAEDLLPAVGNVFTVIRDVGKEALPYAEGVVEAFNDMPDWAKSLLVGGVVAGGIGKKLGVFDLLFGSGARGGSGGLLGKATPLPVFVVNQTGGLGATGPTGGGRPPVVAAGRSLLMRTLGLASLNFLIGEETPDRTFSDTEGAYNRLVELTGAKSQEELVEALGKASTETLRKWRATIREEFDVTFGQLSREEFTGGGTFIPPGFSAREHNAEMERLRELMTTGTQAGDVLRKIPTKVETRMFTLGAENAREDVDRLLRRIDLVPKERETLYRLLGVEKSIEELKELGTHLNSVEDRINDAKQFGLSVGRNARGTDYWRGGLTWVGEEGPEIVRLPRGSQVIPAQESAQIAATAGPGTVINIGQVMPHNYSEFTQQMTEQARAAGLGGRRPIG